MRRYQGTEVVEPGLYFTWNGRSIESINHTGALPGTRETVYHRLPALAMLAVAPLLGLVFLVFLPFIAFAIVGKLLAGKAVDLAGDTARAGVRVLRPNWEPSLAFLSRSKRARKAAAAPAKDTWAEKAEEKLGRTDDDK